LLVDDIEINRAIVREIFSNTGMEITEAADGEEAYHKYIESPEGYYDCVLMDVQMPKMDGYEATRQIRKSCRADSRVPIFAMTSNALKEDMEVALKSGMTGHIAKPIDFEDCLKKVKKACGL